jgi:hypothetical protein
MVGDGMSTLKREIAFPAGARKIMFRLHGPNGTTQFLMSTGWDDGKQPDGRDVGYHWDRPNWYQDESHRHECETRPSGYCYYDGSGLAAGDLLRQFMQSGEDAVWSHLEAYYAEVDVEITAWTEAGHYVI